MIFSLSKKYPFFKTEKIGSSLAGRGIYAVHMGNMNNPSLYAGGFHALEWMTVSLLLNFADRVCTAYENDSDICGIDVRRSLSTRGIIIVPCVNPDGTEMILSGAQSAGKFYKTALEISGGDFSEWNANARGVDINHNFDALWSKLREIEISQGITVPAPRRYGGAYPESEPETRALTNLCRQYDVRKVMALHSQGEEIYWQFDGGAPAGSKAIAQALANASGYVLSQPDGEIASYGGFKDWFISRYRRPGFTIEVGKGKNPLPLGDFDKIYAQIEEMLMLFAII